MGVMVSYSRATLIFLKDIGEYDFSKRQYDAVREPGIMSVNERGRMGDKQMG